MAAVGSGHAEGKRAFALQCEAGRREAQQQCRGQERRLSSPKVHCLIGAKLSVGAESQLYLEVSPCALSF